MKPGTLLLLFSVIGPLVFAQAAVAGDDGTLFGGSDEPVQLHRADGSWVGVSVLRTQPPPLKRDAVRVAIIDSGVLPDHPQLAGLIVASKDFSDEGLGDHVGHGTIDAILTRSGELVKDDAPAPALLIAKVTIMVGTHAVPKRSAVIRAINWAAQNHAKIVNMSLGFSDDDDDANKELCAALKRHSDILFISAAGNSGPQIRAFPAACDLQNSTSVGVAAPWSGAGDIVAPGSVGLDILQWTK